LTAPRNPDVALREFELLLAEAKDSPAPDLRTVPAWVRAYFNPRTLKEAIAFAAVCRRRRHSLGLSCLLGILHHQRPGFLSYPSSHLVPYLRTHKFPVLDHPQLYEYRDLRSRLLRKLARAYKRFNNVPDTAARVTTASIESVRLPPDVDTVITSPPYMNALDYGRDNRLRLWFIDPTAAATIDRFTPGTIADFAGVMAVLATKVRASLRPGGFCVLVVGDKVSSDTVGHTAKTAIDVFNSNRKTFEILTTIADVIPDVRRARRDCRGVKRESVIVLRKLK
jgi:hypothetical protein